MICTGGLQLVHLLKRRQEGTQLGISFGSINTGLPKDIVKQIMEAEKIPLKKMEGRKGKIEDKKKLVGELNTLMGNLKGKILENGNARSLKELKVDTNNELVGVTIDKNIAHPANYQFEVLSLAQKTSAMSVGVPDKDETYTGVGYVEYVKANGEEQKIYVGPDDASLNGIAKLINKDSKNGMHATVVNDGSDSDTPWRLLISLESTGDNNKAEFPYFYFVDGEYDLYLDKERPAQDAKIKVDGFEIEVPENRVKDIIPGVTIDLKKARPGEEFGLNIGDDKEAVTGKIGDFVDSINSVLGFIKNQNNLDKNTDTSRTLGGDILLQTIEGRIRGIVFNDVETSSGYKRVGDIGLAFQRDGTLKLDQDRFDKVLAEDYNVVSEVLTGFFKPDGTKTNGFIDNLSEFVNSTIRFPNGMLINRSKGLDNKIEQIDRRIEQRQRNLNEKEKNLKNKFARLEGTISKIQSQGAGISALGAAPVNAVTQLG
jgi:flagellar hook-associated protein 2